MKKSIKSLGLKKQSQIYLILDVPNSLDWMNFHD